MPIGTLFKDGVDAYLEEEKDAPGAMWFFLHIPKTAGSSFRSELAAALKPNNNIVIDYKRPDIPFDMQKRAVVDSFIENIHARPWRFASGHMHYPHVRAISEAHGNMRILTMLRDPVKRVISDYRYQCTPQHPPHEA